MFSEILVIRSKLILLDKSHSCAILNIKLLINASSRHYKLEKTPSPDVAADSLTVTYSFEGYNSTETISGHYKCCFEEVDSLESFQSGQIWTNVFHVKLEDSNKVFKLTMKDTAARGNIKDKAKTGTEYVLTQTDLPTPMESK